MISLLLTLSLLACGDKDTEPDDTGTPGDGGTSDGGTSDGGTSDGGTSDGGTTDGGTTDGGTTDGGTSDGGTTDGGTTDGGTSDGGTTVLDITDLEAGDLVITEAMVWSDWAWEGGQWVELYNAAGAEVDLEGLRISALGTYEVPDSYLLAAGDYVVLGSSTDPDDTGGAPVDIAWGTDVSLALEEEAWHVEVRAGTTQIDLVNTSWDWDWFWDASYTLDPDTLDADSNDEASHWCAATSSYGRYRLQGTPGRDNDDCPDDNDGDGYTEDIDCDDDDASIYPGAPDTDYDGIDSDCAGDSDYDADEDGYDSDAYGGDDCDDSTRLVRPGAYDIPGDGVDADCDGADATGDTVLGVGDLSAGDLVLSELMPWPGDERWDGWWIEVYNASGEDVLIDGVVLDGDWYECEAISSSVVTAGGYFLFAGSDDDRTMGGLVPDVVCEDMYIEELHGPLRVTDGSSTIDRVTFRGLDLEMGQAWGLDPDHMDADDNDDMDNWCVAVDTYGDYDDYGTPGEANRCPADEDGDGWDELSDCDDDDDSIYPGASETWYDGVDSDCGGDDDYDADGDGERSEDHGGEDCDDSDDSVRTDAFDLPDDGIDQDCDGEDATGFTVLTVDDLAVGDLVITELMPYPSAAPEAPWFEVVNLTGEMVLLEGLLIDTLYERHTIDSALVIEADDRLVFGVDDDLTRNGGVPVDYADWDLWMGWEEEGDVSLIVDRSTIDRVAFRWGAWPLGEGISTQLDPDFTDARDNDDADNWCESAGSFGDGDLGSPGDANDDC